MVKFQVSFTSFTSISTIFIPNSVKAIYLTRTRPIYAGDNACFSHMLTLRFQRPTECKVYMVTEKMPWSAFICRYEFHILFLKL